MPINPRVFFDFDVDGQRIGRVIFELFADEVPKTAENFRALCTGELGLGKISNMPLHYRGSIFHRIIKGFCVQGGDFTRRNGSGGESIYGATFPDESFARKHTTEGLLSMANRGPNTQSSQFFITTRPTPHLDGKHVVFGRVVHGYDIIQRVEKEAVDERSKPLSTVMVANSGELELRLPQAKAPVSQEPSRKRSRSSSVSSDRSRSLSVSASSSDSEDERRRRRRRHHKKHKKSSSKKDKKKNKKKSSSRKHRRRSPSVDSYASDASQRSRSRSRSLSPVTDRREQEQQDVPAGSSSPSMDNVDRIKSSASSHHSRSPSPHHRNRASSRSVSPRSKHHDDHDSRKGRRSYRDDYDDLEDDEKPDWERQRRFPDDPEVQFKGRGRKKYRPSGGGMRAW